jgi:serine O-acetyltransferase
MLPWPIHSQDLVWELVRSQAASIPKSSSIVSELLDQSIERRKSLSESISHLLSSKFADDSIGADRVSGMIAEVHRDNPHLIAEAVDDLYAATTRDPACSGLIEPLLFYKGFHSLQWHRISHALWHGGERMLARWCQSRCAERLAVDIHPAARIEGGVFIDHGGGLVIGETARVRSGVTLYHSVTLGSTGNDSLIRHPTVLENATIGAGSLILGNIVVGEGARIGAGSVVLSNIPAYATAVGAPAVAIKSRIPSLQPLSENR